MHRVDAPGYTTVGSDNRYEDQDLPGTDGTEIAELWLNAVQEEIAHLIEYTGQTLKASGLIDEASNWQQLRQAIFSSAKIDSAAITDDAIITIKLNDLAVTDAKVNDVSLDKLTLGTLDLEETISTIDYDLTMDVTKFELESDGAPGNFKVFVLPNKVEVRKLVAGTVAILEHDGLALSGDGGHIIDLTSTGLVMSNTGTDIISTLVDTQWDLRSDDSVDDQGVNVISTKIEIDERTSGAGSSALSVALNPRGIRYGGTASPGESSFRTIDVRKAVFEYTGGFYARDTHGNYQANASMTLTDIPKTADIYSIWSKYSGDDTGNIHLVPVKDNDLTDDGTDKVLSGWYVLAADAAVTPDGPETATDTVFLYIEYGANDL